MLPKQQRVKKQDFPKILKEGLVFNSPHLSARILRDEGLKDYQIAFVVPSKTAKTSVERHFIKRQLEHLVGQKKQLNSGFRLILTCKKTFTKLDRHLIQEEIDKILIGSKMLN